MIDDSNWLDVGGDYFPEYGPIEDTGKALEAIDEAISSGQRHHAIQKHGEDGIRAMKSIEESFKDRSPLRSSWVDDRIVIEKEQPIETLQGQFPASYIAYRWWIIKHSKPNTDIIRRKSPIIETGRNILSLAMQNVHPHEIKRVSSDKISYVYYQVHTILSELRRRSRSDVLHFDEYTYALIEQLFSDHHIPYSDDQTTAIIARYPKVVIAPKYKKGKKLLNYFVVTAYLHDILATNGYVIVNKEAITCCHDGCPIIDYCAGSDTLF